MEVVLGYTCGNDVSARDWQRRERAEGFLLHGKSFDTFGPCGDFVPAAEVGNPADLAIRTTLKRYT